MWRSITPSIKILRVAFEKISYLDQRSTHCAYLVSWQRSVRGSVASKQAHSHWWLLRECRTFSSQTMALFSNLSWVMPGLGSLQEFSRDILTFYDTRIWNHQCWTWYESAAVPWLIVRSNSLSSYAFSCVWFYSMRKPATQYRARLNCRSQVWRI